MQACQPPNHPHAASQSNLRPQHATWERKEIMRNQAGDSDAHSYEESPKSQ
jgi:hypothetical protein